MAAQPHEDETVIDKKVKLDEEKPEPKAQAILGEGTNKEEHIEGSDMIKKEFVSFKSSDIDASIFQNENPQSKLDPMEANSNSNFKELLETIKNAKISEGPYQTFKTMEEDTYSDVEYENYPFYYWKMEYAA